MIEDIIEIALLIISNILFINRIILILSKKDDKKKKGNKCIGIAMILFVVFILLVLKDNLFISATITE